MMKRISSAALAVLTALLLIIPFVACHGSKGLPAFAVPEAFDAGRDYEISFWAKNDTNKTQVEIYKKAISDFEALYPNIKVNLHLYTDYGRIYNDVITNISTGTTPNVCITYPDHIATYITGTNVVVPLDELIDDPEYGLGGSELRFDGPTREEIIPKFLAEGVVSGKQYALPFMRSTEACYINKTMLEEMGFTLPDILTWDFVWQVAEAAAEKDADGYYKANGQKVMLPFIYKSTDNMMIQMLKQKGAGYSTSEGEILLFSDTTKDILRDVAEHTGTGAFSTFKISSYPGNHFNAGQCILAVDSTAGATWMGCGAPLSDIHESMKVNDFETVVTAVPQFDPEHPKMISQGPSLCIFNKDDPGEVLASWLFAQYLLSDGVQTAYSMTEGYVPVTYSAQNSAEYREYLDAPPDGDLHYKVKTDASKLILDNIDNTFITPVYNGSASLRDAAGQLIEETARQIRRGYEVDDAFIDKLYTDVAARYRLNERGVSAEGRANLGPLPATSVALLCGLASVWAGIGAYFGISFLSARRRRRLSGGSTQD
jgi:multiple sugar transport system substrate-binding protein